MASCIALFLHIVQRAEIKYWKRSIKHFFALCVYTQRKGVLQTGKPCGMPDSLPIFSRSFANLLNREQKTNRRTV